jgi:hypothetical protein
VTHRFTLGCIATAALTIMLSITGTSAAAGPADGIDHHERQQSDHDSPSGQTGKEPDSQSKGTVETKASEASPDTNCGMLETAAARYGLPPGFFRRLIRQESNFDPKAISRAGAMGIAQFMPGTARWRGLSDPFEPKQALDESARWLSELRALFGNLGLAAAAYNAGPQRVRGWMTGRGNLPGETRAYVRIVTGRSPDEWLHDDERQAYDFDEPVEPCTANAKVPSTKIEAGREAERGKPSGWSLQLTGDASEIKALAEYARLQNRFPSVLAGRAPTVIKRPIGGRVPSVWFFVKVAESLRGRAMQLCSKLRSAGGSCLVTPN